MSLRYDALGIPSIPQSLLSCYLLSWEDIIAVGPTKTIVRRGSDRRVTKENDGWITEYVSSLVNALAGEEDEFGEMAGSEAYRSDPAYVEWYQRHAAEYERYYGQKLPKPVTYNERYYEQEPQRVVRGQQQPQQQQRRPQGAPRALPPPSATPYNQALRPELPQQQARGRPVPRRQAEAVGVNRQQPMERLERMAMPQRGGQLGNSGPSGGGMDGGQRKMMGRQPPPPSSQQQQAPQGRAPAPQQQQQPSRQRMQRGPDSQWQQQQQGMPQQQRLPPQQQQMPTEDNNADRPSMAEVLTPDPVAELRENGMEIDTTPSSSQSQY